MSSIFTGLKDADVFERGSFFNPGFIYDLDVKRIFYKTTEKSGICFFSEFTVLSSNDPAFLPGSSGTWCQKMANAKQAHSSIKEYLVNLFGLDFKRDKAYLEGTIYPIFEEIALYACSETNPLMSWRIRVETRPHKTQAGGDFTIHDWEPYNYVTNGAAKPDLATFFASVPKPQANVQISPDGKWQLINGQWAPYSAPAPAPPAMPPPAWAPPGAPPQHVPPVMAQIPVYRPPPPPAPHLSPDGRYMLVNNQWVPRT